MTGDARGLAYRAPDATHTPVCATVGAREGFDPWFPYRTDARSTSTAQALCATCPLMLHCYLGAVERGEEYGTWGGVELAPLRYATGQQAQLMALAQERPITREDLIDSLPATRHQDWGTGADWNYLDDDGNPIDDAPATALRACRQHAVELIPTMLTLMMAGDDSVDGEAGDTLGCVIAFPGPRGPVKLPI